MGKRYIEIIPTVEKEKLRVFNDLKIEGKSIIEDTGGKNDWWQGFARELGQEVKNFRVDGIKPIMPPISNHEHGIGIVVTNKGVKVKTEQKGERIRFFFEKDD